MDDERSWTRHWPWAVGFVVLAWSGFETLTGGPWLIFVPDARDPRLVGRWTGIAGPTGTPRTLVFRADGVWTEGRNLDDGRRRSLWGVRDGRLHVKWLATDAWVGKAFPYRLSADDRTLWIEATRWRFLFPPVLHRTGETPKEAGP